MALVYVYSPFTGINLGQDTYCSGGGQHVSGFSASGFCCPIDIGGAAYVSAGKAVRFYGSASIGSIRTVRKSDFCAAAPPAPYEDAVVVELYRYPNAGCYLGKLFYGHLYSRVTDGVYNNPSGKILGYIPACCADCYGGVHVHIGRDTAGQSRSLACNTVLYEGSTWFYSWYWNEGACP